MKVFTSLMKTLIAIVSIALTISLVMTAVPLVMGGVEVEASEINASVNEVNQLAVDIDGNIVLKSSLPKDIEGLELGVYVVSDKKAIEHKIVISDIGPITVPSGTTMTIPIKGQLQIPSIVSFILADDDKDEPGLFIPMEIQLRAAYGGLLALDLDLKMDVPLSDTANIDTELERNAETGEITSADAVIHGVEGDMLLEIIPDDPIDARLYLDDIGEINLVISKDSNGTVSVHLDAGDPDKGILETARALLDTDRDINISNGGQAPFVVENEILNEVYYYLEIFFGGLTDV